MRPCYAGSYPADSVSWGDVYTYLLAAADVLASRGQNEGARALGQAAGMIRASVESLESEAAEAGAAEDATLKTDIDDKGKGVFSTLINKGLALVDTGVDKLVQKITGQGPATAERTKALATQGEDRNRLGWMARALVQLRGVRDYLTGSPVEDPRIVAEAIALTDKIQGSILGTVESTTLKGCAETSQSYGNLVNSGVWAATCGRWALETGTKLRTLARAIAQGAPGRAEVLESLADELKGAADSSRKSVTPHLPEAPKGSGIALGLLVLAGLALASKGR